MCAQYKYKVFTVETPDAEVPFTGARFTRAAPGGYDVFCQQRIATLASYRPLYQAVLDAELTLMAEVAMRLRNQFGAKPRQLLPWVRLSDPQEAREAPAGVARGGLAHGQQALPRLPAGARQPHHN